MEDMKDKKIKEYFYKDKIISKEANIMFDNVINKINEENEIKPKIKTNRVKKVLSIAACLLIIFIGANVYAISQGYKNIFFMIREIYTQENVTENDILSDRDIIISYQSFYITDSIEMQVNKLQVIGNKAKLHLLVKEDNENEITPFNYKVYNDNNEVMCNKTSDKKFENKTYNEILKLENYKEDTNIIKLEVYSKENKLLKTVKINLEEKIIEAKTENNEVKKISQVKLNELFRRETKNRYINNNENEVLILKLTDISYSNSIYTVKYLYCMPTQNNIENAEVESLPIYQSTVKLKLENNEYKIIEMSSPEKVFIEE